MLDILIIGAGAAGIAAGRRLADSRLSFRILEAAPRLGGRAHTATIEGLPLDLGCGWLHSADRNPWAKLAADQGLDIDKTPPAWEHQFEDLGFTNAEQEAAGQAFAEFDRRLREIPPPNDCAAEALSADDPWKPYLEALSGFINGAVLEQLSVADYLAYEDADTGVNWRLSEGLGAFVAGSASALPIDLSIVVEAIEWSRAGIVARTSAGTIEARRAIVTVSTEVLARERLRFTPPLPDKVEAAARLPLGLANKAFLALDRPEPFEPDTQLIGDPRNAETGAYYLRPFGYPVIECFFGGAGARGLEAEGEDAATAFGIEQLVHLLGSDMRRRLRPLAESRWAADALIGGSYSHALPGHADARAALAEPVADRLFFAGEACSAADFSTAHGAWETGVAAAEAARRSLGRPGP